MWEIDQVPEQVSRRLILASSSRARAELLRNAGISFDVSPVTVDEEAVRTGMQAEGAPARDVADALAELKAYRGAMRAPRALVLGADQVLVCGDTLYGKPESLDAVRDQLLSLRGRTHELLSAAVIYEDTRPVWRNIGRVRLTMRPFTEAFLDEYIAAEGDALLETVGCYRLEGRGAQLFSQVSGDYFSVLGLPLLEILGFLRTRGIGKT